MFQFFLDLLGWCWCYNMKLIQDGVEMDNPNTEVGILLLRNGKQTSPEQSEPSGHLIRGWAEVIVHN